MIPVYLCHVPTTTLRDKMFELCLDRWIRENDAGTDIFVVVLTPRKLGVTKYDFQKERRVYADKHSPEEFYIVADDDCLPGPEPFAVRGIEILKAHPEFARLAPWHLSSTNQPWEGLPGHPPFEDDEVVEHVSVGNIRFCRKGCLEEWPEQIARTYDSQEAEGLRAAGWRSGYFKNIFLNHVGQGYSGVWP